MKTDCDYLNGWIKKWSHMQKSHPEMVNPRSIAGNTEGEEEEEETPLSSTILYHL